MDTEDAAEVARIRELLRTVVRVAGVSNREMERQLGQSPGYLSRLFAGTIEIKLRHVLEILRLVKVEPAEFFHLVYPRPGVSSATGRRAREVLTLFSHVTGEQPRQAKVDEMVREAVERLLHELSHSSA